MIVEIASAALTLSAIGLVLAFAIFAVDLLVGMPHEKNDLVVAIDKLLPQTQCAQCGYPGCKPYAQAIAEGASIDLCPPGGEQTQIALAELLNRELGTFRRVDAAPQVARIREADCIGCALCSPACPVDAIVGAEKFMHTIVKEHCTGCELCIAPCPVDCIELVATS